eukprot:2804176-Amphidinium_carterae.2
MPQPQGILMFYPYACCGCIQVEVALAGLALVSHMKLASVSGSMLYSATSQFNCQRRLLD